MKLPSVTKKFWIVAISVAMVASFLAFYLLIYVKDRESHIISKNYRALDRLGKNILELKNSYEISIARFNAALASSEDGQAFLYHAISYEENDFKAQGIHFLKSGSEKSLAVDTVELTSTSTVDKFHFHISTGDILARTNLSSAPFNDFFLIRIVHVPRKKTKDKTDSVFARIAYQTFSN
ncbi:MAG TPA: hypothetical protein VFG46_16600, partial [Chryseolinea sp.]|nr:hypothetical protein [Chryseolinea sp.]